MTTPKQNRKIVQALLIVAVAVAGYFAYRWYTTSFSVHDDAGIAGGAQMSPAVVLGEAAVADLAAGREYVGKVEAIQAVDVRPQVAGEIDTVHFKEGSFVKAGQLLFTLDSRQYRATVALREAELAQAEANYDRAVKYYSRLKSADVRSVSASDLDTSHNDVLQGKAAIDQAKASLALAKLDVSHTRITAPIAGRIGAANFTKGNYVTPSSGALANITQIDPIRIAFAVPDREFLERFDSFAASGGSVYNASVRLPDGSVYQQKGERDFEDNVMDEATGTITVRLRYKNDKGVLVPGSMVRVEAKPAKSRIAVVIPQQAILADAEGDYVYHVDDGNVAHQRRVKLGAEAGTMREVTSGIEPGEKLVVRGLQALRPEIKVTPMVQASNGTLTPAELAMQSVHDVPLLSADAVPESKKASREGAK